MKSRRRLIFLVAASLVPLLLTGAFAQPPAPGESAREAAARLETANGLHALSFDTLEGTVTVNLPADMAAGDTISGTVVAEPKGDTPEAKAASRDQLTGLVVEVAEQETPAAEGKGKWALPAAATSVALVLKDAAGRELARRDVPLAKPAPQAATIATSYAVPALAQAGRALEIKGKFDGDAASTMLTVAGESLDVLAESPRSLIAAAPAEAAGTAVIAVEEQGRLVANCTVRMVGVRLASPKTSLRSGERATMSITITGLEGLDQDVTVKVHNLSPGVVGLQGGPVEIIKISPRNVTGGVFRAQRTLTGRKAGGFNISAAVERGDRRAMATKACEPIGLPAPGPFRGQGARH